MSKANRIRDKFRALVIGGLMLVSLLMMGLLSHQIFVAVSSQKQLVEGVLKDYSALAADEFTRRSAGIMYVGYLPMLRYLSRLEDDAPLPSSELFNWFEESEKLAQGLFRFSLQDQTMETSGLSPPKVVVQRLLVGAQVPYQGASQNSLIRSFNTKYDGTHYNFVYTKVASNLYNPTILGVWINNEAALNWLRWAVASTPLLPATLTQAKLENENVFVKLLSGKDVIYMQGDFHPDGPRVMRRFDNHEFVYGNMSLTLGIAPDVGPSLIIGGLPSARLPFVYGDLNIVFAGLWFIAAILMIIALVLIYRDQSLAFMRTDFVSRVSHELRTPLAQIIMFAQTLMLGRVRSDEERQRSLEVIDKEAQRLSHLVDNILQFSRIDRGLTKVNMVACLINPLVREMVDQFRVIMKEGQLEIISTVESSVEVMLDVDAFRQMFLNILDNAVKFSPMGEKIEVKLLDDRNGINLSIEDRGPGVPMRSRERIWDPYYRVHTDAKSAVGGTGIGLAIVRELARLQNLYVSMAQREGGGSKFMITINKKKLS